MAVTPDLNQIAVVMSRLQHNYSQLVQNWYDVFFNSEEKNITVTFFDENGNLTTNVIPNRAKDFRYIKNGEGDPTSSDVSVSASVGTIYQDLTGGNAYIKRSGTGSTGWIKLADTEDIEGIVLKGNGDPEGVVVANRGALFIDKGTGSIYIKTEDNNNTGWKSAISASYADKSYVDQQIATTAALKANTSLDNLTTDAEKHFLNKTQVSNCILETPNDLCTVSGTNITLNASSIFLIADGRTDDKTLNNIEYTTLGTEVYTSEYTSKTSNIHLFGIVTVNVDDGNSFSFKTFMNNCTFYQDGSTPKDPEEGFSGIWFVPSENKWKYTENGSDWTEVNAIELATFDTTTTGEISNLDAVEVISLIAHNSIGYYLNNTPIITLETDSSGKAYLTDNAVHSIIVNSATEFVLPTIVDNNKFHQMLILLNMATASSITFNADKYFYNSVPSMEDTGKYTIVYEYDGSQWAVGAIYKG